HPAHHTFLLHCARGIMPRASGRAICSCRSQGRFGKRKWRKGTHQSNCGRRRMQQAKSYVRVDQHGVMRVGTTPAMLDSVVASFLEWHGAETIQQQYPALSLEEVYGALAYYLGNKSEVEDYLRRQEEVWEPIRSRMDEPVSTALQRLRTLQKTGGSVP